MGLGDPSAKDIEDRLPLFEYITPLNLEMRICANYLHCTHKEFRALPLDERRKWLLYEEMERRREGHINKMRKAARDMEQEQQKKENRLRK